MVSSHAAPDEQRDEVIYVSRQQINGYHEGEVRMECPRCKTAMITRTRAEIEIDVCEQCGGVWLDRGELAKILEGERERSDAEKRENWRLYDRGRDAYDPAPEPDEKKSTIESLLG
jgi:Zn-finger nucleic acid-binding protein